MLVAGYMEKREKDRRRTTTKWTTNLQKLSRKPPQRGAVTSTDKRFNTEAYNIFKEYIYIYTRQTHGLFPAMAGLLASDELNVY